MQSSNRRAVAAYTLILSLVALMSACGGGSSSKDKAALQVTQVQLVPNPSISMQPGDVVPLFAAALNANGAQIFTQTITFSSSNNSQIQIGTFNGQTLLCAGTWDNTSNAVVCNPLPAGSVPASSNITASAGGVTSPTTVASVHLPITSVTITPSAPACVAEKGTQVFNAHAFNGATDITTTVGTFNWFSQNTNVATIPANGDSGQTSQATATAVHPGQVNIIAQIGNVSPISSTPAVFQQCLVASIRVTVPTPGTNESDSHFELTGTGTRTLNVEVRDSTNAVLSTLPTLNWNTTQSAVANVAGTSTGATVTAVSPGAVGITASCLPDNCNIGTQSTVTSNLVTGTVGGTAPTSANAYVTCTSPSVPCTTAPSGGGTQTQLFPINGTTLGTAINLPHTPNSMMINRQNSKIFIGSSAGLMVVDANTNAVGSTLTTAPGNVLAVAPNGIAAVISNGADVFLFNGSTAPPLLNGATHITNAVAAAFTPDSGRLFIVTSTSGGEIWFEVAGATPVKAALAGANDITFLPSGTFAIAATSGGSIPVQTCDQSIGGAAPSGTFDHVVGVPTTDSSHNAVDSVVATASPDIHRVDYSVAGSGTPPGCPFTIAATDNSASTSAFTANQLIVSPDSTHAFVIAGAKVLAYDIAANTVTSVALPGASALTGAVAANGAVYVGGGADNKVHVITSGTDAPITTTIPADLVVAKSH